MIAHLPQKRLRPKMGVQKPPQREWRRHRRFVKSHGCCVPGCTIAMMETGVPIDFAHVKTRGAGGHDCFGVSLCRVHHREQHNTSIEAFGAKYGIDLWALALARYRDERQSQTRRCRSTGANRMLENAEAIDILGDRINLPLSEYHLVRFTFGSHDYIDVEMRDGRLCIRGQRQISVEPSSANQIFVDVVTR